MELRHKINVETQTIEASSLDEFVKKARSLGWADGYKITAIVYRTTNN